MDLSLLPDRAARNDGSFTEKLGSMAQMIDRTLDTVRHIVTELRPIVLDKIGLVAAIEWQTEEFQKHSGIVCETHLPTREISLDPARSTALFRILQEALTNVARHSGARKAIVELRIEAGNIVLTVCDDGKGIDEMLINAPDSIGLLGIRERMLPFGGRTQVACRPEGGTLVCVELPAN
jgi:signal transduction histidine kinase